MAHEKGPIAPDARQRFIETYSASFLAAWAAQNYAQFCAEGRPTDTIDIAPVEDAEFQAVATWDRMVDLNLEITKGDI